MTWHKGLKRLRLIATASLVIGLVLIASVLITQALHLSPDTLVAPLFAVMWPLGVGLLILGGMLWTAVWVLMGFVPETTAQVPLPSASEATTRAHFDR